MVAGQADAIQVVRMVAVREDAILVARMAADQGDAILVARMAADQADAIPVVRMVADPEAEILAALMVARKERTPAALPVAVRKIADPGDAHRAVANCCLAVANRLDARLHCVGSTDVRRLPTGLARGAFPLQTLEDAAPKTEAQAGVGLTILPRTVERQVDQPQDLAVRASRWEAPGDRAPASWDRHQVECSRLRVDPVAAWPRS